MESRDLSVDTLLDLCNSAPQKMRLISFHDFSLKPSTAKWSKKEILGHLIDSATANHHRFVRGQFEETTLYYDQDLFVSVQNYQAEDLESLILLWEVYNRHLAHVIKNIPESKLENRCVGKDGSKASLAFLIDDYLKHLQHHLAQII